MNRRKFCISALGAITAVYCHLPRSYAYQVQFFVDLNHLSEGEFFEIQSQYEDNAAIDRLSAEYIKQGWMLGGATFQRTKSRLVWTYQFKSKAHFYNWEHSLYDRKIVQQHGRPYEIGRKSRHILV